MRSRLEKMHITWFRRRPSCEVVTKICVDDFPLSRTSALIRALWPSVAFDINVALREMQSGCDETFAAASNAIVDM